ncbi:MAG: L-serine ammonia-lyase, iron-sulfur-dependent, subunit alpha [Tissierellia bacterium]|nr:L-serine ammonia-lyase, iron-sulfur-dependent, subunit alpha [Tissierellia bacterium]
MLSSVEMMVKIATDRGVKISELMIEEEMRSSGKSREEIVSKMQKSLDVMKSAVKEGIAGVTSTSGMTGGDAKKIHEYIENGKFITDTTLLKAVCYAVATNEVNASMGVICATPTAGSSGILPGVMIAIQEKYAFEDDSIVEAMFTAGAFGYVIANNASISGAAGGCQAEIGSASAMTAGALTELMGGTPRQAANAMAMAMKNMLGLACDPLAGLVEVPCIKRNGAGATNAILASELALANVETKVPWDEVIEAMFNIGQSMPAILRETALGGLATTKTGEEWKEKLWK